MSAGAATRAVFLRRAGLGDLPGLAELERAASPHPWSERQLREELVRGEPDAVLVLEGRAGLVGYCATRLVLDEVHIMNLLVHHVERRSGLGRFLVEAALARARRFGARLSLLEVRESNAPARALYRAAGFTPIGRRKGYYSSPVEDALVFSREERPDRP